MTDDNEDGTGTVGGRAARPSKSPNGKAPEGVFADVSPDGNGRMPFAPTGEGGRSGVKDLNDLLQVWVGQGVRQEDQVRAIRGMMDGAPTMVEVMAGWAGGKKGSERDEAQRRVFAAIKGMDKTEAAQYRKRLADGMQMGLREFTEILKEARAKKDGVEAVPTLGFTRKDGWIIEYLYDEVEDASALCWRDEKGKIGYGREVEVDGVLYCAHEPTAFIRGGGVIFASELGPLKPTRELVAIVEAFIHRNYLLEDRYLGRIITYYVLLTWLYDCFNALPYLRTMGEAGAGKSELMKRVGFLCYRLMMASGANTSASFFRATEQYKGTVFIDEADLQDGGDMSNDLVKFLNLGAMKGNPIWRLEEVYRGDGTKSYEVATFSTFCPKLIAMRKDFRDDAVGSRSLTIKLQPREPIELKARGVKLYIDDEFRKQAKVIRNCLLRWRMEHWKPQIDVGEELMDLEISSRLNQVTMPLKALASDDQGLQDEIEKFLRAYNREMVLTKSMTIAARVVEALWKIHVYPDLRARMVGKNGNNEEFVMIGDVREIANEIMDEMNRGPEEEGSQEDEGKYKKRKGSELTARGVGHIIRNELQLQVGERRGSGFPVYWDEARMVGLAKRYGVVPPEVGEVKDLNHEKHETHERNPEVNEPKQGRMDPKGTWEV